MKPHVLHAEADAEYEEAVRYYAGIMPDLGGRFFDEIERLMAEAATMPQVVRFIHPPARRVLPTISPSASSTSINPTAFGFSP